MKRETLKTLMIASVSAGTLGGLIGSFYGWDDAVRGIGFGVTGIALIYAFIRAMDA